MNKYFKPLDWEINDYITYINEPSTIDLSPYLNYIIPEKIEEEKTVSYSVLEGGLKESSELPILPSKAVLPKSKSIKLPKEEIKGKSELVYPNKTEFKDVKDFIKYFVSLYKAEGLNDDLALTLANQDALESWTKNGLSRLARDYNNYGGIKSFDKSVPSINLGTHEYLDGRYVYIDPKKNPDATGFRVFKDAADYIRYKVKWMSTSNKYKGALSGDGDHYISVITGNNPGGYKYATAPNYADYLRNMISKYKTGGPISKSNWWEITPYMYSGNDILYSPKRKYDINQTTDEGDRYYDIVNNRVKDAEDALIRNGFGFNSNFLKHLLAVQSILETGWVDNVSNNNYGGHRYGGNKSSFDSKESFWDNHIRNLNNKWGKDNVNGAWYSSTGIQDYINRINNPELNTTKIDYDKYNLKRRKDRLPEQYLYAPIWDNEGKNYLDQINSILDRYFYYYNNRQNRDIK